MCSTISHRRSRASLHPPGGTRRWGSLPAPGLRGRAGIVVGTGHFFSVFSGGLFHSLELRGRQTDHRLAAYHPLLYLSAKLTCRIADVLAPELRSRSSRLRLRPS